MGAGAAAAHQHEAALAQVLDQMLGGQARRKVHATATRLAASVKAQGVGPGGRDLLVGGGGEVFGWAGVWGMGSGSGWPRQI
jgi:hypothetical protein